MINLIASLYLLMGQPIPNGEGIVISDTVYAQPFVDGPGTRFIEIRHETGYVYSFYWGDDVKITPNGGTIGLGAHVRYWWYPRRIEIVKDPLENFEFSLITENFVLDYMVERVNASDRLLSRHTHHLVELLAAPCYHCRNIGQEEITLLGERATFVLAWGLKHKDAEIRERCQQMLEVIRWKLADIPELKPVDVLPAPNDE